jgi:hypothetical protein
MDYVIDLRIEGLFFSRISRTQSPMEDAPL